VLHRGTHQDVFVQLSLSVTGINHRFPSLKASLLFFLCVLRTPGKKVRPLRRLIRPQIPNSSSPYLLFLYRTSFSLPDPFLTKCVNLCRLFLGQAVGRLEINSQAPTETSVGLPSSLLSTSPFILTSWSDSFVNFCPGRGLWRPRSQFWRQAFFSLAVSLVSKLPLDASFCSRGSVRSRFSHDTVLFGRWPLMQMYEIFSLGVFIFLVFNSSRPRPFSFGR